MSRPLAACAGLSLLASGAMFGFFYAWVCSTMWGLDAADPAVAIAAMQAMNASVRNAAFAPAFFGTPALLLASAALAWRAGHAVAARAFLMAALAYLSGATLPTALVNVPMNEALALVRLPLAADEAQAAWSAYSAPWQRWNLLRTAAAGLALAAAGYALYRLAPPARAGL